MAAATSVDARTLRINTTNALKGKLCHDKYLQIDISSQLVINIRSFCLQDVANIPTFPSDVHTSPIPRTPVAVSHNAPWPVAPVRPSLDSTQQVTLEASPDKADPRSPQDQLPVQWPDIQVGAWKYFFRNNSIVLFFLFEMYHFFFIV